MSPKAGEAGAVPKADQMETKQEIGVTSSAASLTASSFVGTEDMEDVPDPEEDDLDDLDEMLDDFSTIRLDNNEPATSAIRPAQAGNAGTPAVLKASGATSTSTKPAQADENPYSDEEFAKQLQAGMEDLLGEMESSPEIQAQFESIFKELGAAAVSLSGDALGPDSAASSSSSSMKNPITKPAALSSNDADADANFQETIKRTMKRMQASGDQATAAAAAGGSEDFVAELLKQMQAGGTDGEANEEEVSRLLMGMMEQLTNKEILYEPMKELNDKFPQWMVASRDKASQDDLKRYEKQQELVKEIVAKFEEPSFSDSNAVDREYIVDRMQKMQAAGAPPADLVGDMPSAQDALSMPDESCSQQ